MIHHSRHDFINLFFVYFFAIATVIILSQISSPVSYSRLGIIDIKQSKSETKSIYNVDVFNDISIKGKAYVVYDIIDNKIIASKNKDEVLPLASLTKIMTALTAAKHNSLETPIKIVPQSLDGGYDFGLKKNQVWKLSELLKYTLVFSSNDGAQEIADTLGGREYFVKQMNQEATLFGLTTMQFTQPAGLDLNDQIGGVGSASDVAKLFAITHRYLPKILDSTTKERLTAISSTGKIIGIPNTNQYISNLFGAEASKTGLTNIAGGNLAVIVDITIGRPIVIVVLGSTREGRFSDVDIIYNALINSLRKNESNS